MRGLLIGTCVQLELGVSASSGLSSTRGVYPYSVVPGGAADERELAAAAAAGPVVAGHYRDIAIMQVRPTV